MSLQTSIPLYHQKGQAGQVASLNLFSIYQAIPGWVAGSAVPFGRLVSLDTTDNTIDLPSAAGQIIAGVTVFNPTNNAAYLDSSDTDGIASGKFVDILTQGDIWVSCESATAKPGESVYVRHTADGSKTTLGGVANATGTGLELVPGAMFISTASDGLAIIKVNK
jgi:hypothetical protein